MRWRRWLLRGLAAVGVIAIIALWTCARPLPETMPPTPSHTHTLPPPRTHTPTPTQAPNPTPTHTQTPAPTITPTPSCTETTGRVEQRTYLSQTTADEEVYRVYLPPCYEHNGHAGQRYPVLYLLHGWPYDDAHWDNLGADEDADAGIQTNLLPYLIIVMPRGREHLYVGTSGGDHSFEGQVVNDLIPHIDATYRTHTEREGRAIGGISRGGVWALEIGFLHPGLFAAVGAHSPALSVNLAPQSYDPFYLLTNPGVGMLRIYLDAGDLDWAREGTQALHEALDEQGIANELVVHSGGHANVLWEENMVEYLAFYAAGW
ncbi:MAG: alpha/beta hydrolase-fold protein [Chloroflexota bacterium]|nr:alpha/beta hydrolase-fold protein [Chloroflexota bacterium]